MNTPNYLKYIRQEAQRDRIRALCTDDPTEKEKYEARSARGASVMKKIEAMMYRKIERCTA